jgi:hypothetical protein
MGVLSIKPPLSGLFAVGIMPAPVKPKLQNRRKWSASGKPFIGH